MIDAKSKFFNFEDRGKYYTSNWNHLGLLISIPGVRNILQSQEVFLMDAKSIFLKFEDIEDEEIS